jgi:hypothetical protein
MKALNSIANSLSDTLVHGGFIELLNALAQVPVSALHLLKTFLVLANL